MDALGIEGDVGIGDLRFAIEPRHVTGCKNQRILRLVVDNRSQPSTFGFGGEGILGKRIQRKGILKNERILSEQILTKSILVERLL